MMTGGEPQTRRTVQNSCTTNTIPKTALPVELIPANPSEKPILADRTLDANHEDANPKKALPVELIPIHPSEKPVLADQTLGVYHKDATLDDLITLKRKSRKRPRLGQKKKRKLARHTFDKKDDETGEENVNEDVLLLKEAQRLRDSAFRRGLPQAARTHGAETAAPAAGGEDEVAGGLQKSFAAERSGHAVEERMARYIDEKMRERFGDTEPECPPSDVAKRFEEELYAVPKHLRATPRALYDPGEGLPAAGVEEVELPIAIRDRNERATAAARAKLLRERTRGGSTATASHSVGENVAANFMQHRKNWMDARLGPKAAHESQDSSTSRHTSTSSASKVYRGDAPQSGPAATSRRHEVATDSIAMERFRKRWRRQ